MQTAGEEEHRSHATLDRYRSSGGPHMSRFSILVIGRSKLYSGEVKDAWAKNGFNLRGPLAFEKAIDLLNSHGAFDGVLIDVTESAEHMVHLVERLEPLQIPFLFVASETDDIGGYSPYEMNARKDDIDAIFHALMQQGDSTTRH